jgi:hypothetical protein
MGVIGRLFYFYIHGSFHVAMALVAFLAYTDFLYAGSVPSAYYGLLFFGAVAGYNAIKYGAEPWKKRPRSGAQRVFISVITAIAAAFALGFGFGLSLRYWLLVASAGLLTAVYALPLLPGFRNLRSFGLLKVPLVAMVWVHLTLWIPLWDVSVFTDWNYGIEGLQRLLWVCLLMIPFEIRDMDTDPAEMRTLPMRLGLPRTRRLVWIAAMIFVLMTLLKDIYTWPEFLSKFLAALWMGLAVQFSGIKQKPYYASFWVESIPIAALTVYWAAYLYGI